MMVDHRRTTRWSRAGTRLFTLGLVMVLLAACLIGPDGNHPIPTIDGFRAAVVLFDPWFWTVVGNSVVVALATAAGSLFLGSILGRIMARWRFWLRAPLAHMVLAGAAVPPLVFALGLRHLLGPDLLGTKVSAPGFLGGPRGLDWLCLTGANLARGIPLVALAAAQALRRIEPLWEAGGLAAGATHRKLWSGLARPLIRGAVARATAAVFGLTLLEPATPLILTLRRTVGFQLCEGVRQGDPVRTAALVLVCGLIVALTRWLARRSGPDLRSLPVRHRPRTASWRRAIALVALLAGGLLMVWSPLCLLGLSWFQPASIPDSSAQVRLPSVDLLIADAEVRRILVDSVLLGVAAASLALFLAWLTRPAAAGGVAGASPWESTAMVYSVPCAVSLALVRLPVEAVIGWGGPSWLHIGAEFLSPLETPWAALVFVLALAWTPMLRESLRAAARRWPAELRDAALAVGPAGWRVRWKLVAPLIVPVLLRGWIAAAVCAGCDASVAVLVSVLDRPLPIGPAIAHFQHNPDRFPLVIPLALLAAAASATVSSAGLGAADRQKGSAGR